MRAPPFLRHRRRRATRAVPDAAPLPGRWRSNTVVDRSTPSRQVRPRPTSTAWPARYFELCPSRSRWTMRARGVAASTSWIVSVSSTGNEIMLTDGCATRSGALLRLVRRRALALTLGLALALPAAWFEVHSDTWWVNGISLVAAATRHCPDLGGARRIEARLDRIERSAVSRQAIVLGSWFRVRCISHQRPARVRTKDQGPGRGRTKDQERTRHEEPRTRNWREPASPPLSASRVRRARPLGSGSS